MVTKEEKEFLRESNFIEGEYSDIALDDAIEAWNYAKGYNKPINIFMIRKIHKILLQNINPRIAGKFRRIQVGVMTQEGFKEAIPWHEIKEEIRLLSNPGIFPVLSNSLIKRWHIQFEHIHPFEDGNGRVGRILLNLQRIKNKEKLLIIHQGEEQQNYYQWFRGNK